MSSTTPSTQSLLEPFISTLTSSSPIPLSDETLYGAITHFLSSLPLDQLQTLINAIITSPNLWENNGHDSISKLNDAFKLSVTSKLSQLSQDKGWFAGRRRNRSARSWLRSIIVALHKSIDSELRKQTLFIGLLEGLDEGQAVDIDWGFERSKLEEKVVIYLHQISIQADQDIDGLDLVLVCKAIPHISNARLKVLNLHAVVPKLELGLSRSLDFHSDSGNESPDSHSISQALSKVYSVLAEGSSSDQSILWDSASRMVVSLKAKTEELIFSIERNKLAKDSPPPISLTTSLIITQNLIPILLSSPVPSSQKADLSTQIISTLAICSLCIDPAQGVGLEGYYQSLYGALDIIASTSDTKTIRKLFVELASIPIVHTGPGLNSIEGFILMVGEQLIDVIDGRVVVDILLPLCDKHLHKSEHLPSFESAHSFFLSFITRSSQTLSDDSTMTQKEFLDEALPYYARLLVKQFIDDTITSDQFRSAYPSIVSLACAVTLSTSASTTFTSFSSSSELGLSTLDRCLNILTANAYPESKLQTIRLTRINLAPHIPLENFKLYLIDLEDIVSETLDNIEERQECLNTAFKMVSEDFGEDRKIEGLRWWDGVIMGMIRKGRVSGRAKWRARL